MRLLVHVEGQTEETFVNEVLAPHLLGRGYSSVSARLLGNARLRRNRGGIRSWHSVSGDVTRHLQEDPGSISTLMVDYYGLPSAGTDAWPGRSYTAEATSEEKAKNVEDALLQDLIEKAPVLTYPQRFFPFVLMHEFEALLFSDCVAFARGIEQNGLSGAFQQIRNGFGSPEDINDSPLTAPSKRILGLVLGYEKPLLGTLGILEIGLPKIRQECKHFDSWLTKLEAASSL